LNPHWGEPNYALNVARLPIPPLRRVAFPANEAIIPSGNPGFNRSTIGFTATSQPCWLKPCHTANPGALHAFPSGVQLWAKPWSGLSPQPAGKVNERGPPLAARPRRNRIEGAIEQVVERPFTRRANIDLPLMKGSLRRAMEDELKLMPPSRYTIVVPDETRVRLRGDIAEWERELSEYFLDVVRDNGWSAVSHPIVKIVYDPALRGSEMRVAVDESYLVHHGGTRPKRARTRGFPTVLISSAMLLACAYLLALLAIPGLLPSSFRVPDGIESAWRSAGSQVDSWWDAATGAVAGRVAGQGERGASADRQGDERMRGEVTAHPWLSVRAGTPGRSGGVHPNVYFPRGMELEWSSSQVVAGESVSGEDRWILVGTAGPEWGDREGQDLYIWMGGLRVVQ
jgi:hypothetical protein